MTLIREFHDARKIAESILTETKDCFQGNPTELKTGQIRVMMVRRKATFDQILKGTKMVEVTWTVDAGQEDLVVLRKRGLASLRKVRIQRLLDEALQQSARTTRADLSCALQTSARIIKRDIAELHKQGLYSPSRGYLHDIGRGQTYKAQIIRRWLQGESYDQLSQITHQCISTLQRYLRTFVQVVSIHQRGASDAQIGLRLQIEAVLVRDYLNVYQHNSELECRQRLEKELTRYGQKEVK